MSEPQTSWFEVSRSPQKRKIDEHALVLQSLGIPYGSMNAEGQWILLARADDMQRVRGELQRYERENVGWPPKEVYSAPVSQGIYAAIGYATLLALMFIWQRNREFGVDWLAAGRAQSWSIVHGEWWRAITALTLHLDIEHLLGNVVFGSIFGIVLAQSLGVGMAWIGFLVSGALGNGINAWIQGPDHASIGASTAVFGALGVQAAYEWMKRRELRYSGLRRWAPVIGGLALLGWLGTGGSLMDGATAKENVERIERTLERVDVMAHVVGFAAGIGFGLLLGLRKHRWRLSVKRQFALTMLPVAVIAIAWIVAATRG